MIGKWNRLCERIKQTVRERLWWWWQNRMVAAVVHISVVSVQMVISSFSFICEDLLGLFIHTFIHCIHLCGGCYHFQWLLYTEIANQLNENTCKAFSQLQFRSLCGKVFCILCVMCTVFSGLFFFSYSSSSPSPSAAHFVLYCFCFGF